jgi:hypothetical protein
MKYMLLVYGAEDSWTQDEREQCMAESTQLCHELQAKGHYLAASPLQSVAVATSVRVRDERRLVTDGPFAETTEQLGGYFLVDVENLDEAIAIAGRIPGATKGTVEIRPVVELGGLPQTSMDSLRQPVAASVPERR